MVKFIRGVCIVLFKIERKIIVGNKILEVNNLNKHFGSKQILYDVSFDLEEGEILGFIGPNGAGKTTTIKLILGLQSIESGSVKINGFDVVNDFERAISRVGAIVESPDTYMYMSGRANLKLMADYYGDITDDRIERIIDLIGLGKRIDDKVSKYSLGMRQRLGIGAALLHNPNVLILDEPTNGLDPEGIKEVRELLVKLAKEENIGILISSHNLAELDNFVTNACIIQNGKILATSSVDELKKANKSAFVIDLNKTDGIEKVIKYEHQIMKNNMVKVYIDREDVPTLLSKLLKEKFEVYEVRMLKLSLEDAFLEKTGGNVID